MSDKILLLGQTLCFASDPFLGPVETCFEHNSRGGVLLQNGKIADVADGDSLRANHPDATVTAPDVVSAVPLLSDTLPLTHNTRRPTRHRHAPTRPVPRRTYYQIRP